MEKMRENLVSEWAAKYVNNMAILRPEVGRHRPNLFELFRGWPQAARSWPQLAKVGQHSIQFGSDSARIGPAGPIGVGFSPRLAEISITNNPQAAASRLARARLHPASADLARGGLTFVEMPAAPRPDGPGRCSHAQDTHTRALGGRLQGCRLDRRRHGQQEVQISA